MAGMPRKKAERLVKWVQNTTLPAKTLGDYLGIHPDVVALVIQRVRGKPQEEKDEG